MKVLRTLPFLGIFLLIHDLENKTLKRSVAHVLSFNICCFLIARQARPAYDHHCFHESDVAFTNLIRHVPSLPSLSWTRTCPSFLGHQHRCCRKIDQAVKIVWDTQQWMDLGVIVVMFIWRTGVTSCCKNGVAGWFGLGWQRRVFLCKPVSTYNELPSLYTKEKF